MTGKSTRRILFVGGSDPEMGAGLQMDTRMAGVVGCECISVSTSETFQDKDGLHSVEPTPIVAFQESLARAFSHDLDAIKTGAMATDAHVKCLAEFLDLYPGIPLVVDPVGAATKTAKPDAVLLTAAGKAAMVRLLFPQATVVTPNLFEYADGYDYAQCKAVYLKGGHGADPDLVVDVLIEDGLETARLEHPRIAGATAIHGTGCALGSLMACALSQGLELRESVRQVKTQLIRFLES
ncbi:MAG: hypothetical protein HN405_03275 [Planctomycetes bacterium]|nr:hypothetical protein [Planctomycetota bacterium]MBT4029289.1 hypothetical protein [Planctomycetota bacterium]MBT4561274.1 hypothetical protein [Planctomycetota bacterium]MBT5101660.1 hypothetical protein [Planctomycetota bacterium]MBT7012425.1 hypothetical protein [Planctomycetota bacterium]